MHGASLKRIYLTLLLALFCQLLPWSGQGLMLRPDFMLLVLIYWLLRAPHRCNIGTAWLVGLLIDLIDGSLFGQNALAYAITAFFAVRYQRRLALFNLWQQAAYVFALLLLTQTLVLVLRVFSGGDAPGWDYFLRSVSGITLWLLAILPRIGIEAPPHRS